MEPGEELYIVLSDLCNISCDHCISSSGPQSKRFLLDKEEVEQLTHWINIRHRVRSVHFSGGEPTLQIELIQKLQAGIRRLVNFTLTTNGWFGKRPESVLDSIKIDEIYVSYDKFHAKYISEKNIKTLLKECVKRKIRTSLKFTIEEQADLKLASNVLVDGVKLFINRLIQAGRYNSLGKESSKESSIVQADVWDFKCPSISERTNGLERLVYYPGKGLSLCCGPLSFDGAKRYEYVFSSLDTAYTEGNHLRKLLDFFSFRDQAQKSGIDISSYSVKSQCDACFFMHADLSYACLPSRYTLVNQPNYPAFFETQKKLNIKDAKSLCQKWDLNYLFLKTISLKNLNLAMNEPNSHNEEWGGVTLESVDTQNICKAMTLYENVYLRSFMSFLSKNRQEEIENKLRSFLLTSTQARLYLKKGEPVALFAAQAPWEHPLLSFQTVHIGFVGYDRNKLTHLEAQKIKNDWISRATHLGNRFIGQNTTISARIQWFNENSQRFFENLGFVSHFLEINKNI
ncbi:MAG: radical SAM protein [Bdellovibrio sp.]|nr:radical SAM protein [Bdellovibrio sp.]